MTVKQKAYAWVVIVETVVLALLAYFRPEEMRFPPKCLFGAVFIVMCIGCMVDDFEEEEGK